VSPNQNVGVLGSIAIRVILRLMMVAAFGSASIAHPILCVADGGHVAIELADVQCDRGTNSPSQSSATAPHEKCSDTPLLEIPFRTRDASGSQVRSASFTSPPSTPLCIISVAQMSRPLAPSLTFSVETRRTLQLVPLRC
jgi:hypothetical protein